MQLTGTPTLSIEALSETSRVPVPVLYITEQDMRSGVVTKSTFSYNTCPTPSEPVQGKSNLVLYCRS
jgi:hypothetical protein